MAKKTLSQSKRIKNDAGRSNFWQRHRIKPQYLVIAAVIALVAVIGGFWTVNYSRAATGTTICKANDHRLCLVTHGPYNELTVGSTNKALWARTNLGNSVYMFHNGAGNCLRVANDGYTVEIGSGGCSSNIASDRWVIYGNPAKYGNQGHNCYMAARNYGPQYVFCTQSTFDPITYEYQWFY